MDLTIEHVEVHVSSLQAAKHFYVDLLELEILEEVPAIDMLALKAGQVRISIFAGFEGDPDREATKKGTHIVFRTVDIDRTFNELSNKGMLFEDGIVEAPGFIRFISTRDPDGNTIEIGQYLRDPLAQGQLGFRFI